MRSLELNATAINSKNNSLQTTTFYCSVESFLMASIELLLLRQEIVLLLIDLFHKDSAI